MTTYGVTVGRKANVPGSYLPAQLFTDMHAIGLKRLRFQVPASEIMPGNWGIWDDTVSKCQQAGISLCLSLMQPAGGWNVAAMANFAGKAAARYAGKVDAWDIGNEDFDQGAGTSPEPLAAALTAIYPKIKAADPGAQVLMGAILMRNAAHMRAFMDGVWQKAGGAFDRACFHFYTCIPDNGQFDPADESVQNVPSAAQVIALLAASHQAAGHPDFPTRCTEFGFAVQDNFGRPARCVTDEATQWKYLQYCYETFRGSGFIEGADVFTLGYGQPAPDGMSLVQANGHQTVAYQSLTGYIKQYPSWEHHKAG
jgi:hypothetical protein